MISYRFLTPAEEDVTEAALFYEAAALRLGSDFLDDVQQSPKKFAQAIVRRGLKPASRKAQLTLRLDRDVLEWYRKQGQGYQTRVNALLRAYMDAHKSA